MSKKTKSRKHKSNQIQTELLEQKIKNSILAKEVTTNNKFLSIFLLCIPLLIGLYFLIHSHKLNGYFGFPLDDPWIHLTFAKNLVDYGSFSYFKNEIVTSGSTSPIYTLVLSVLFLISSNEYIISYLIGILFNILTVLIFSKLVSLHFGEQKALTLASILIIAVQPKLNLISVSGMETTMFIFLIVAGVYFYKTANKVMLGIFLGLLIWCRPDGFVLWLAILIDYLISNNSKIRNDVGLAEKTFERKDFFIAVLIAIGLAIVYFLFNYALSGDILPNTYKAKIEYYQHNLRENFLRNDVLIYFSNAEFIAIVLPFIVVSLIILIKIFKKQKDQFLIYFLFTFGLITTYYIQLPFAHRFGRYLMPVIPFYILVSVYGLKLTAEFAARKLNSTGAANLLFILFFVLTIILSLVHLKKNSNEFAELCKYHNERHVAAGLWIKNNTPEDAIIAAHDIGAIGFYGNRKVIDMVGLVTPEVIHHLNDKNFSIFIEDYLLKNNVNYITALKNWFEIVNDNPIYVPVNQFEILEIYKFKPQQTHIQPREVSYLNEQAIQLAQRNDLINALRFLRQSLSIDPNSSKTNYILGAVYELARDTASAETYFNKALKIFPDYLEGNFSLARIYYNQNKFLEAIKYLDKCLQINSDFQPARQMKESLDMKISGN